MRKQTITTIHVKLTQSLNKEESLSLILIIHINTSCREKTKLITKKDITTYSVKGNQFAMVRQRAGVGNKQVLQGVCTKKCDLVWPSGKVYAGKLMTSVPFLASFLCSLVTVRLWFMDAVL